MTTVAVNTAAHTVTHIASKMLMSIKTIIVHSGLDPGKLADQAVSLEQGIATWLASGHLQKVTLEIFHPQPPNELVCRWDIDVNYSYSGGDGSLWTDPEQLKYCIEKCGIPSRACLYRVIVLNAPGEPAVAGWSSTTFKSTEGFRRYGVGASSGGVGIAVDTSYWSLT